jgi:arylsulfatase A-like enzyme
MADSIIMVSSDQESLATEVDNLRSMDVTGPSIRLSSLLLGALVCCAAGAAERPNVLFIAVDDLNDWTGCLGGHPQALTPNIDRLAERGVLFANAHCAAPACNPSRAAVFSGRMPHVTGVWANRSGSLGRLYPNAHLLPTAFSESGYQTFGTGKLLHSGGKSAFDEYFSVEQRWSPLSKTAVEYTEEELPTKGTDSPRHIVTDKRGRKIVLPLNGMPSDRKPNEKGGESFDWGPFDVPDSEFGDTQITDWATEKIKQAHDKPFFLGVGYYRPHIPLWAPRRYFDRFLHAPARLPPIKTDDLDDLSPTARAWALEPVTAGRHSTVVRHKQWRAAVEAYLACIAYVDHEIGRLLDVLDNSPFADDTAIVLWSDHGWHLGEKQHWGKWTGWERSTKVPLIIVPPKRMAGRFAAGGSRCDQPVGLIDIYPTLVELCGVAPRDKLDGKSLVPLLREPKRSTGRAVVTTFDRGNTSLRTEHWRYIRYADGSEELYDHRQDPNEWNNLAADEGYAGRKESLRQTLAQLTERIDPHEGRR